MTDILNKDIGSDRAAFATLSALVSRDPHVTGDPATANGSERRNRVRLVNWAVGSTPEAAALKDGSRKG